MNSHRWKIVMLPRLQVDAVVACFFLKYFGERRFPGIKDAEYLFWVDLPPGKNAADLEKEEYVLLDMGGGAFDHHKTQNEVREKCVSEMMAEYLGVAQDPAVRKLLQYARRDDIEGRGTLSRDPIDRAFGLSGLLNNLNRMLPDEEESVLGAVMPLLLAHYLEEKKRTEELPAEYQKKRDEGKAIEAVIQSARGPVKMVTIETDEVGMAGYLRAKKEIGADIVVQKMSSGHVNIVTQQKKSFDLSEVVRLLREGELKAKDGTIAVAGKELTSPGRVQGIEEWYFDTRAKTIQNGGIRPQWTTPTRLSLAAIGDIVKQGAAIKL